MLKCSPEAYAKCSTAQYCGSRDDAIFMEGSECDRFNRAIDSLNGTQKEDSSDE